MEVMGIGRAEKGNKDGNEGEGQNGRGGGVQHVHHPLDFWTYAVGISTFDMQ